jgi:hypothetical protein
MRYGLIEWKFRAFRDPKDSEIIIRVEKPDDVDREEAENYEPTERYWYYPETLTEEEVRDKFIDKQIQHFNEQIKWYQSLIKRMEGLRWK